MIDIGEPRDLDRYVHERYNEQIQHYRKKAKSNQNSHILFRRLSIVLGALATFLSTLLATDATQNNIALETVVKISTPLFALSLTVMNGFSKSFPWGPAWRDATLTAIGLEKARDNFLATRPEDKDHKKALDTLNSLVRQEAKSFFGHIQEHEKQLEKGESNIDY